MRQDKNREELVLSKADSKFLALKLKEAEKKRLTLTGPLGAKMIRSRRVKVKD